MTDQLTNPVTLFDIWNPEFLAKLPKLRLTIEEIILSVRGHMQYMASEYGPLQITLEHKADNEFKDTMFDCEWKARSPEEQRSYDDSLDTIFDCRLEYNPNSNLSADIAELTEAIGEHKQYKLQTNYWDESITWTTHNYHEIETNIQRYMNNRFDIEVLNESEVVKQLQQLNAEFRYVDGKHGPQLVIADRQVGLMMKLKYG